MNIATVYAWFARESVRAAEKTDDVRQRQMWMTLAEQWAAAARQSREKACTTEPRRGFSATDDASSTVYLSTRLSAGRDSRSPQPGSCGQGLTASRLVRLPSDGWGAGRWVGE
jgi:hypothetical protein